MPGNIEKLIQDLSDAEFVQRPQGQVAHATEIALKAKNELIAIGSEAVPGVIACLMEAGPRHQRALAAQVLGEIGDNRAASALIIKLRDPEMVVRGFSAEALGKTGDKRAVKPLLEMLEKEDKKHVIARGYAENALNQLGYAEKRLDKVKLWKRINWLGVFILIPGALTAILVLFTLPNTNVAESDWPPVIGFVGISIGVGGILIYMANRPIRPGELDKRVYKKKLWGSAFIIGLLMLMFGIVIGITALTSTDLRADGGQWPMILICAAPAILLGSLAIFLSTRTSKK
jgi:hypothetical protein